jgi:hypothetical protein
MTFPLAQRIFGFIISDFLYLEMNQFIRNNLEINDSIYDWIFVILDICDYKMFWSRKTSDIE